MTVDCWRRLAPGRGIVVPRGRCPHSVSHTHTKRESRRRRRRRRQQTRCDDDGDDDATATKKSWYFSTLKKDCGFFVLLLLLFSPLFIRFLFLYQLFLLVPFVMNRG